MTARDQILSQLRQALGVQADDSRRRAAVEERVAAHARNLVPARGQLPPAERVALFVEMARATAATVEELPNAAAVPAAVQRYLAGHNLPAILKAAPHPALQALPWDGAPSLTVAFGGAAAGDEAALSHAFAAVAETGTLALRSGPESPVALNFLPDTHIVVVPAEAVVGGYEEVWDRLRDAGALPRAVNYVTGPSRTGDIEQTIQLGAHGPRRLHILVVGAPARLP
ncbi:MAG TPA: lactate utilization protein [Alphaproteobacteria bacterium]|nr:lactate utilization protein [Alphaproteobacteria bacterium]